LVIEGVIVIKNFKTTPYVGLTRVFESSQGWELSVKNKNMKSHREFSKVNIELHATVQAKGGKIVSMGTHDVSMKSLFVKGKADWSIGTECEIHLILEGQNPPVDIEVKGRVQRVTEKGIALLFTEVGLEAYEHLYNLVMLNTDNPERAEQEFNSQPVLKKK
jgi:hypothetical protein